MSTKGHVARKRKRQQDEHKSSKEKEPTEETIAARIKRHKAESKALLKEDDETVSTRSSSSQDTDDESSGENPSKRNSRDATAVDSKSNTRQDGTKSKLRKQKVQDGGTGTKTRSFETKTKEARADKADSAESTDKNENKNKNKWSFVPWHKDHYDFGAVSIRWMNAQIMSVGLVAARARDACILQRVKWSMVLGTLLTDGHPELCKRLQERLQVIDINPTEVLLVRNVDKSAETPAVAKRIQKVKEQIAIGKAVSQNNWPDKGKAIGALLGHHVLDEPLNKGEAYWTWKLGIVHDGHTTFHEIVSFTTHKISYDTEIQQIHTRLKKIMEAIAKTLKTKLNLPKSHVAVKRDMYEPTFDITHMICDKDDDEDSDNDIADEDSTTSESDTSKSKRVGARTR